MHLVQKLVLLELVLTLVGLKKTVRLVKQVKQLDLICILLAVSLALFSTLLVWKVLSLLFLSIKMTQQQYSMFPI